MLKEKLYGKPFLINLFIALIFLAPTSVFFYGLMYAFLIGLTRLRKNNYGKPLVFLIFISMILNINGLYDFKDVLIALNIVFLVLFFPYGFKRNKISCRLIYVISIYILISQLCYIFEINLLINFFEAIYKNEDSGQDFTFFISRALRNGGIYFNPNQASKYLTLLLALVITANFKNRDKFLLASILFISVILTGSRTGLITFLLIMFGYSVFHYKRKIISVVILLCGMGALFLFGKGSRSLNFGQSGSASYKIDAIKDYISVSFLDRNFIVNLFGNFTTNYEYIAQKYSLNYIYEFGFDAEIGMIISTYGIVFLFFYCIYFYYGIIRLLNKETFLIIIPFLIWPLTSTILFSIKTSIVYFVTLGLVIGNNVQTKKR